MKMKKLLYLMIVPVCMITSCGGQQSGEEKEDDAVANEVIEPMPDIDGMSELQTPSEEVEQMEVSFEELPEAVTKKVKEDSLLSLMEMKKASKVTIGEKVYYDLTFKTEDSEELMVSIDSDGNVIEH
ncbi:hypothetical protein IFO69_03175 [Echinicola sp. CAU 1574]|uniref:PepSY domain-containing protein n=1 Tax=Echinicola arenosa TaxID=2774144 RepID=A0ABR9AIR3_9BACT|nr:hypothetical protein [Echinicola arenosa]MBD8487743.1 hypothetical protein [Echinicola arenosa]